MPLQNIPSVMDLINDGSAIAELDAESLGLLIEDSKALSAAATKVSRALQGEAEHRYTDQIRTAYAEAKRDTGVVYVREGDVRIEVTRPKKVEWDQDEMKRIADAMTAEGYDPGSYIDIHRSVPEKLFVALPEGIQRQFLAARTVTPGSTSVRVKVKS